MPIRSRPSPRPPTSQPAPEVDEAKSRTAWPERSDEELTQLRRETQEAKSAYRRQHRYLKARALERINAFERRSTENRDRVLTGRLQMLAQPEDDPLAFSNGEITNLVWASSGLFDHWRELLAHDQRVPWSELDLQDFRSQLAAFDAQVEAVDRELALRAAKRRRLEAEAVEASLAAR